MSTPWPLWLNDRLVPPEQALVSALDHGLTVGDGVFETLKVVGEVPFALTRHLDRLGRSALGLGLPAPDAPAVRVACAEVVAAARRAGATQALRLRVTITGGPGPLGSDRGHAAPTLVVAAAPATAWASAATLVLVPWTRNERSPVAGIKTTSYAENVVALARAKAGGGGEALLLNTRGELCEGTGSNVFVVVDGQPLTPPVSSGCLPGVTRGLVLEWCGARERVLLPSVLSAAQEVFITSSTRDVQAVAAVRTVDGPPGSWEYPAPGPVTEAVVAAFRAGAAESVDP